MASSRATRHSAAPLARSRARSRAREAGRAHCRSPCRVRSRSVDAIGDERGRGKMRLSDRGCAFRGVPRLATVSRASATKGSRAAAWRRRADEDPPLRRHRAARTHLRPRRARVRRWRRARPLGRPRRAHVEVASFRRRGSIWPQGRCQARIRTHFVTASQVSPVFPRLRFKRSRHQLRLRSFPISLSREISLNNGSPSS